jgi:hypothetical protein
VVAPAYEEHRECRPRVDPGVPPHSYGGRFDDRVTWWRIGSGRVKNRQFGMDDALYVRSRSIGHSSFELRALTMIAADNRHRTSHTKRERWRSLSRRGAQGGSGGKTSYHSGAQSPNDVSGLVA